MNPEALSSVGDTILRILEEGGALGIQALLIYLTYNLLRIAVIGGVAWLIIRTLFTQAGSLAKLVSDHKSLRISLLSKQVSEDLSTSLQSLRSSIFSLTQGTEGFARKWNDELKALEKRLDELSEPSTPEASMSEADGE